MSSCETIRQCSLPEDSQAVCEHQVEILTMGFPDDDKENFLMPICNYPKACGLQFTMELELVKFEESEWMKKVNLQLKLMKEAQDGKYDKRRTKKKLS